MMRLFGLIGYPLSHSFSAGYFARKFKDEAILNTDYQNFPIASLDDLPGLIKHHPNLLGLNVTIPYKEKVIPYLDEIDVTAGEINAVNTLKIKRYTHGNVFIKGYNTDAFGFESTLRPYLKDQHQNALILGTGGASKAVEYTLRKLEIWCRYISRNASPMVYKTYDELVASDLDNIQIIVNTTPLGMYPAIENFPALPYEGIQPDTILYDLIYNPDETVFLRKGKARGALTLNGLAMLKSQAEKSWEIWNL